LVSYSQKKLKTIKNYDKTLPEEEGAKQGNIERKNFELERYQQKEKKRVPATIQNAISSSLGGSTTSGS